MPTYELSILLRVMTKPDIVDTVKRTAKTILSRGGIIRKIENLGLKKIPYKISSHGAVHHEANYFMIYFDAPPKSLTDLNEEYSRDVDIVRKRINKQLIEPVEPCTLDAEIKPPLYRLEVQKMLEEAKKTHKKKFKYNSGLDYYPFQK